MEELSEILAELRATQHVPWPDVAVAMREEQHMFDLARPAGAKGQALATAIMDEIERLFAAPSRQRPGHTRGRSRSAARLPPRACRSPADHPHCLNANSCGHGRTALLTLCLTDTMLTTMTQPPSPDLTAHSLYQGYYQVLHKIRRALPPPLEPTPEGYARRDIAVADQIALLVPATAVEAELAAKFVAGSERWTDCLREANERHDDPQWHDRLTRQAALMGREARGFLTALQRVQTMRMKREATRAGAHLADLIENNTRGMFMAALADPPNQSNATPSAGQAPAATPGAGCQANPPQAEPAPGPEWPDRAAEPARPAEAETAEPARPPATIPHLTPMPRLVAPPAAARRRAQPREEDEPKPDWAEEAERYAIIYPARARLIRQLGGLPSPCTFGPPERRLLRAIVAGTSPALLALDGPDAEDTGQRLRYA